MSEEDDNKIITKQPLTRSSKQLGDFGEGLATYIFIRKGYEVAVVDHVGADLIVEKQGRRFAVSVKTRLFRSKSKESKVFVAADDHLEKLCFFAAKFNVSPLFTQIVAIADRAEIKAYTISLDHLIHLPKVKLGYSLRIDSSSFDDLITAGIIDHSKWCNEVIGQVDF